MERKPVIVIMTSKDECDNLSEKLAQRIRLFGAHNVVTVSDDKYGSPTRLSALDRMMDNGQEYQYLFAQKDRAAIRNNLKLRKFSKRVNRINNLTLRYHPEFILAVTPYAQHCAAEAKRRAKFDTKIIGIVESFTAPKTVDDQIDMFIVENGDIKADLIRKGVKSKNIQTMGLPYDIMPVDKRAQKLELGLGDKKSVYVKFTNKKTLESVFSLMVDQGDVATFIVDADGVRAQQQMSAIASKNPGAQIVYVTSKDSSDDYLAASDIVICDYEISLIYKCMRLGVPSIVYSEDEHASQDVNYLASKGLCLKSPDLLKTVSLLYKLLDGELASEISANCKKWTELSSADIIAAFLASYIAV